MLDFSFIRLEDSFAKAKDLRANKGVEIAYNDQIQLSPREHYLQVTNTINGIAFDGNYAVYIVDCSGNELKTITDNVAISEFTDSNGVPQIAFEVVNIITDYYKKQVFLKFVHTVSDAVWYSNPLIISDYLIDYTTRFDYWNATDDFKCSIRLRCYRRENDTESVSSNYVTDSGFKLSSKNIITEYDKYLFERIDNFTYRRLNRLLTKQVIYIDGYRMTDKSTISSKDIKGNTNIFDVDFKCAMNYSETFTSEFQIYVGLDVVSLYPLNEGIYTLDIGNITLQLAFNKNISLVDSIYAQLYKDGILQTLTDVYYSPYLNQLEIDMTSYTLVNGTYSVVITPNQIYHDLELWQGFAINEWTFTVQDGEYDATEYNNEFLTN